MGKLITFNLKNELMGMDFGTISFNGKFVFTLDDSISIQQWKEIGFIPLLENGSRTIESDNLFYYLNSRLPIDLRKESSEKKLEYIKKTGLKVASDSFYLEQVNHSEDS
jgi:hypothetical protein